MVQMHTQVLLSSFKNTKGLPGDEQKTSDSASASQQASMHIWGPILYFLQSDWRLRDQLLACTLSTHPSRDSQA
jgi:hypothetical protein